MNLTIRRGTHEIGGSCVKLEHDACRIVLDLGKPLMGRGSDDRSGSGDGPSSALVEAGVLPPVKGLYWDDERRHGAPRHARAPRPLRATVPRPQERTHDMFPRRAGPVQDVKLHGKILCQ